MDTAVRTLQTIATAPVKRPPLAHLPAQAGPVDGPLTSEPPLAGSAYAPLTSEPPLTEEAPLTSEPTLSAAADAVDDWTSPQATTPQGLTWTTSPGSRYSTA
ncbi:hypothetical protein ABZ128_22810 [Streptomyces sp. NPDC006326]|uniref:hypothetical protein n=1 Tax=Streptomyces sp. NPDC006326 TaxID=3156752 RepID=UPI0033B1BE1A